MEESAVNKPLRFGCPACGIRLVVDQSIAGTEGPCPSCGALIVAPPVDAAQTLVKKEAPAVVVRPRNAAADRVKRGDTTVLAEDIPEPVQSVSEPVSRSRSRSRRRSVSPTTIMSDKHADKENTLLFVKIFCAVAVVAGIALATYYILKNAN